MVIIWLWWAAGGPRAGISLLSKDLRSPLQRSTLISLILIQFPSTSHARVSAKTTELKRTLI